MKQDETKLTRQALQYRRKREALLGVPWHEMTHHVGRPKNDTEEREVLKLRRQVESQKQKIAELKRQTASLKKLLAADITHALREVEALPGEE